MIKIEECDLHRDHHDVCRAWLCEVTSSLWHHIKHKVGWNPKQLTLAAVRQLRWRRSWRTYPLELKLMRNHRIFVFKKWRSASVASFYYYRHSVRCEGGCCGFVWVRSASFSNCDKISLSWWWKNSNPWFSRTNTSLQYST